MSGPEPFSPWSFPPPDTTSRVPWSPPAPTEELPPSPAPAGPPRSPRGRLAAAVVLTIVLSALLGFFVGRGIGSALDTRVSESSSVATAPPPTTVAPAPADSASPPATAPSDGTVPPQTAPSPTAPPATDPRPAAPSTTTTPPTTSDATSSRSPTSKFDVGVVDIDTKLDYQSSSAAGTGMIVTTDGQVLTNNHVIDGATSIRITVVTTGAQYDATVVGTDPTDDIALLQINGASGLTPANIGTASNLKVGDAVTSVGNALGAGGRPTAASGTVSDLDQTITASDGFGGNAEQLSGLIQTDARMQPGMSGGPLYDAAGKVVGMNTAGSSSGERRFGGGSGSSENYAITIDDAMAIVTKIQSGHESDTIHIGPRGFLGVEVVDDDPSTAGAVIGQVLDGTPAAGTDLTDGDIITSVDGESVASGAQLGERMQGHEPGDKVAVVWVDANGSKHTATVTLIAAPAD
jgi:S1-C subfamily serine protease